MKMLFHVEYKRGPSHGEGYFDSAENAFVEYQKHYDAQCVLTLEFFAPIENASPYIPQEPYKVIEVMSHQMPKGSAQEQ